MNSNFISEVGAGRRKWVFIVGLDRLYFFNCFILRYGNLVGREMFVYGRRMYAFSFKIPRSIGNMSCQITSFSKFVNVYFIYSILHLFKEFICKKSNFKSEFCSWEKANISFANFSKTWANFEELNTAVLQKDQITIIGVYYRGNHLVLHCVIG